VSTNKIIETNLRVVAEHFHNENSADIDKALELYTSDAVWEAPGRGQVYRDPGSIRDSYLNLFRCGTFHKLTTLRRFATEEYVVDDEILDVTITDDGVPNLTYPVGTRLSARLVHIFEMRGGKIAREIVYELWREKDGPADVDVIPDAAVVVDFSQLSGQA
jgi:ketosteroid isomerase-like protein